MARENTSAVKTDLERLKYIFPLCLSLTGPAWSAEPETVTVSAVPYTSISRQDITLIDNSRSETTFTENFIEKQDATLLSDLLHYVPGAMPDGYSRSFNTLRLRGFDVSNTIHLDGMLYDSTQELNIEMFSISQVKVASGPASSAFGEGMPGGMANLTSKQPDPDKIFLHTGAAGGSWSSYDVTLDGNRSVAPGLTGRFVGVMRHQGSFISGSTGSSRFYAAPSLNWQISPKTDLTLLVSYQHDRLNLSVPLPAEGTVYAGSFGKIPLDTNVENPGRANIIRATRWQVGYLFRHTLTPNLSWHSKLRFDGNDQNWWRVLYPVLQVGQYLYRSPYDGTGNWTNISTENYLNADLKTAGLTHKLTFGSNFHRYSYGAMQKTADATSLSSYMLLDLKNPDYADEVFPTYTGESRSTAHISDLGVYFEDHISYQSLHMTAGARWDKAYTEDDGEKLHDAHISPNIGLNWRFWRHTHLYGNYSTSFLPQSGSTYAGASLKPENGRQWEVGLKSGLLDDRLYLTFALYTLTRSNVARTDPSHTNYYLTTGRQRSRGVEISARWQILQNWDSLISYSYTDARVMHDPSYPKGDQLMGVPQNSVSLWSSYSFTGQLSGLEVCGNLSHYASQAGNLPNSFRLPAYTRLGGGISYSYGPAKLSLHIKNLLNSRYFAGSESALAVLPGEPRNLRLGLQIRM